MADARHVPEPQERSTPSDPCLHPFEDEPGFTRLNEMKCHLCSQPNPKNHKYCGFCGVPLHAPLLTPPPGDSAFSPPSLEELQFLRERNTESGDSPRDRRGWFYLVVGVAVLLAGFAAFERYYEPDAEPRAAAIPAPPLKQAPASVPTPAGQPASNELSAAPREQTQASEESGQMPLLAAPESAPLAASVPVTDGKVVPAARVWRSTDDGSRELADAMRELSSTNPARNPEVAASLLWKSVGKGNVEAEVILADLFLKGEGVSRSCDQARLLLRTAAGKGSSDAVTQLRTLDCK